VDDSGLDRWIAGFEATAKSRPSEEALLRWGQATEEMYDRSQEYVHIITGDLFLSGERDTAKSGWRLVGTVSYGGPEAPYAEYEFGRGGDHDALLRAYVATHDTFEKTLAVIMEEEVQRWL
jgi:hypothetical protein